MLRDHFFKFLSIFSSKENVLLLEKSFQITQPPLKERKLKSDHD